MRLLLSLGRISTRQTTFSRLVLLRLSRFAVHGQKNRGNAVFSLIRNGLKKSRLKMHGIVRNIVV
ncbi:hypothetical protein MNBD_DELTA04-946 [hydrothermal vent metagenome]|uniref:Uncharacterized protein n=1 Tax=hydrothermal vent metagenome TaxID=652676 RepID=A0A3B0VDX6_9ZZZZ